MADFSTLIDTVSLDEIERLRQRPGFLITNSIYEQWFGNPQYVEDLGHIWCFALCAYGCTDRRNIARWLRHTG